MRAFNTLMTGIATGVALPVLLNACASAPPFAERYVAPPVGVPWTVQVSATGSFGTYDKVQQQVTMRDVVVEGRSYHRFDTAMGATLQDDSVGLFEVLSPKNDVLMRYDPPLAYDFPLAVGKTWVQDLTLTVNGITQVPMHIDWKVEAYEDITVPAGTFKAWRIVWTDNFGYKQTTWSMPNVGPFAKKISERPAGHPQGGAGTQITELVTLPVTK